MNHRHDRSIFTNFRTLFFILSIAIASGCDQAKSRATEIYSSSPDIAEKKILTFAQGVWTFTEPFPRGCALQCWKRLEVSSDGTAKFYDQPPTANNWGKPLTIGKIVPISLKEDSAGKRIYGWQLVENHGRPLRTINGDLIDIFMIREDGLLLYFYFANQNSPPFPMVHKDVFPFSK